MSKKSKRGKGRSRKWSRANIMNYVAGAIVAVSMILGSIFVFGGAPTPQAQSTPVPAVTQTAIPSVGQAPTPTISPTPAP